jgi:O-acetyl-ADP-ribose deacetylase (regulator of RNase III)
MQLVLWDTNPEVVFAWTQTFSGYAELSVGGGSILEANVDALVSPANSFGYMNGGVDLAYRNFFGLSIEWRVREMIEQESGGELPVGSALVAPTGHERITRLIVAPTMKTPRNIRGSGNVYQATKAALRSALAATPPIQRLGLPGMGTGTGGMDRFESAEQMLKACVEVLDLRRTGE